MSTEFMRSLSFFSTLTIAACDLAANDGAPTVRELVADAAVTLPEAIDIAAAKLPGAAVVEAELEVENTTPTYEVRLLADGALTRIHVDPDTGMVIRQEQDTDADDVAHAVAAAGLLAVANIDAAISTAEARRPGGLAFEFAVKDGLIEVEVADETGLFEISIDPATGVVMEVETSDDDHGSGSHDSADDSDDSDDSQEDPNDSAADDTANDSPDDDGGAADDAAHDPHSRLVWTNEEGEEEERSPR